MASNNADKNSRKSILEQTVDLNNPKGFVFHLEEQEGQVCEKWLLYWIAISEV